ncbi:hypothetical protein FEM48_Zijuj01G0213300 [Ziziphus jujuba var. spinosa]|uniref:Uncharacterized protein n=1 Tax=Ziziphus jujuba var. spinosa TaxID=714518 RepID=A0A978W3M2_ZIZJJ|nr:hypothetical protein FEM48_Zijuj01G0213300 [Ziziphus jujuba var. spinosa]
MIEMVVKNATLPSHAWTLMQEGKPDEVIDPCMGDYKEKEGEVLRCIHISLLCVKQSAVDRPSMSSVVMMLGGEVALVQPEPLD